MTRRYQLVSGPEFLWAYTSREFCVIEHPVGPVLAHTPRMNQAIEWSNRGTECCFGVGVNTTKRNTRGPDNGSMRELRNQSGYYKITRNPLTVPSARCLRECGGEGPPKEAR